VKVERLEVDSRVVGRAVLTIHDFDPAADFGAFERAYLAEYAPRYVAVKIPLENLDDIHRVEDAGFRLVECQILGGLKLRKPYDTSRYPYRFERVEREEDLPEVLDIAGETFIHDRFRVDAAMGAAVSGQRYREYVRESLRLPDQRVYRLVEDGTGRVVAFKTHRYTSPTDVTLLLGGVHPDYKSLGLGIMNGHFELNELLANGVRNVKTRISAANYPVFNADIGHIGFRPLQTSAVLRKLYA
jgi:hypothetical protein